MSAERRQRGAYVWKAYSFRVFVQMAVVSIGIAVLLASFACNILALVEIFVNDLVMSILISSADRAADLAEGNGKGLSKGEVYRAFMIGIAVLVNFVQMIMLCEPGPHMTGDLVFLGLTVFVQFPLAVRYWKYVRDALSAAVYYEKLW